MGCKAKGELREEVTGSQEGRGEWYILGALSSAKRASVCLSSERTDSTLQRKGLACKCCSLVGREDMANTSPHVKACQGDAEVLWEGGASKGLHRGCKGGIMGWGKAHLVGKHWGLVELAVSSPLGCCWE